MKHSMKAIFRIGLASIGSLYRRTPRSCVPVERGGTFSDTLDGIQTAVDRAKVVSVK